MLTLLSLVRGYSLLDGRQGRKEWYIVFINKEINKIKSIVRSDEKVIIVSENNIVSCIAPLVLLSSMRKNSRKS